MGGCFYFVLIYSDICSLTQQTLAAAICVRLLGKEGKNCPQEALISCRICFRGVFCVLYHITFDLLVKLPTEQTRVEYILCVQCRAM